MSSFQHEPASQTASKRQRDPHQRIGGQGTPPKAEICPRAEGQDYSPVGHRASSSDCCRHEHNRRTKGKTVKKWRVAELYAGIGRTWEALKSWPNAELCLLADVNESAQETYLANFPNAPYHLADLAKKHPLEIETLAGGPIDVLLGCPPCQGFS